MHRSLWEDLQTAFGGAYRLERELGGGGMSRVYLAEEIALARKIVIKVLPPDFAAGLNAERFRREIQLAARLQHPHIVPVLAAGQADGLLYYTMPFIEGESLRARLAREHELPVAEAVRLLREVADALSYAHDAGVVHRDIKPDNVMLSRHHALVTDFGVAKALSEAAGTDGAPGATFTSAGVAMGTPAYMAPEQATADPAIDHRADIYALGAMAYEMLTGQPPFAGRTAQQLLAAQVSRTPEPLTAVRPSVPPDLAAVVMRCLEKRPADRWQSAAELVHALEIVTTPTAGTDTMAAPLAAPRVTPAADRPARPASRRRALIAAAAVGAVLVGGAVGLRAVGLLPGASLLDQGVLVDRERILISDFRSPPADSALGGAVTEAFRIDLAQSPAVTVVPPEHIAQVLARMQRDPRAVLDPALAREVAIRDGVKAFVTGEIAHAGTGFVITARLVSSETGDALIALRENATDSSRILHAIDRLSKGMRRRIGESLRTLEANEPLEHVSTASLDALRRYSQALAANREGDPERAIALLHEAIALDSGFAMAYRKLGVVLANTNGRRSEQVDAFTRAYTHRARLTDRERYLTQAAYETYVTGDRDRAMTAYRSVLDVYPNDTYALNNLSIAYSELRNYDEAAALARRAIRVSPEDATFYFTLIGAHVGAGRLDSARAVLAQLLARHESGPHVLEVAAAFAAAEGVYDSATTMLVRMRDMRRESPTWRVAASLSLAELAALQGHLADAEAHFREGAAAAADEGRAERQLLLELLPAALDLWYRGRRDRALQRVDAALARYPLADMAASDRPYLELGLFYAEGGRPERARALLAEFDRVATPGDRRLAEPWRHMVDGVIALAESRPHDAIAAFRRLDAHSCPICAQAALGRAYELAGERDSAIAAYERYVATPFAYRTKLDAVWLARAYLHLGELYEENGDREQAARYYAQFVRLWHTADPELRPKVADAKRRLAALTGERTTT